MKMFENVLVGVDGRANGRDAIALATRIAGPGAQLTLVHVHAGAFDPAHAVTAGMLSEEHDASHQLLERERAAAGVSAELVSVVAATPGRGLHAQAEELGADLLVVGSSERGVFGRAMLGDDTRASLNGSPCAVAVASGGYAEEPVPITRVGVGYDGSDESERALAVGRAIGERQRASLRAMQVVNLPTYAYSGLVAPVTGDTIDTMLAEAREQLNGLEDVETRAVYGLVGEELAAFGDELDLLIVGSRGYGPWQRLVLGSTSNYLQRHARCSLLVLPRAARSPSPGSS
jgi:nucleotide-binding universal stress UspA family protein